MEQIKNVWKIFIPILDDFGTFFEKLGVVFSKEDNGLVYHGPNAFDLLCQLFGSAQVYANRVPFPHEIITEVIGITTTTVPHVKVWLKDPKAVMPSKKAATDVGYDLTLVSVDKVPL